VQVIVPDGIDDPTRPSGGNTYDRQVCRGLAEAGWSVHERVVPGSWPEPDAAACAALAAMVASLPDGAVVLLDGLIASAVPEVLVPEAARLRLVVLVHMPLGERSTEPSTGARESAVLSAAAAVVTTSDWSRCWLLERYPVRPSRVHVARPGVGPADLAPGSPDGGHLLCVAAVVPDKGHDLLLAALAEVDDLPWRCDCVGSLTRDPGHVERLLGLARSSGIADRVSFTGPRTGDDLEASYAGADALVLATRAETYGMVVSEALAHGLPVLATSVGGLPEALGRLPDGGVPGLLVPPDDPAALAAALRRWLVDEDLRVALRERARGRRTVLSGWSATSSEVARVLAGVST
jgi:glycosyltransferase involved in cell wall biosynthesis